MASGRFPAGSWTSARASDAAVRETLEETGLAVDLTGLLNVYSYPGSPVIVVYRARVTGGTLTPCAENDLLEWRAPAEIPWETLAFDSTREALREWVAAAASRRAADRPASVVVDRRSADRQSTDDHRCLGLISDSWTRRSRAVAPP